jgi:hypothetical protein
MARAPCEPFTIARRLFFRHRAIAELCGGRALEGSVCEGHVTHARVKRSGLGQRRLRRLDIWEKLFVSQQMPDRRALALLYGEHTQQPEAAFKLKDQIIARCKCLCHVSLAGMLRPGFDW